MIIIIVNLRFFLEFRNKVLIIIPMHGFLHGMRENSEKIHIAIDYSLSSHW